MANGFFLGGMAEGMESARKGDLAERSLTADVGLRQQAQTLHEKQFAASEKQQDQQRGDALIANTMSQVHEIIKAGLAAGRDPASILNAVRPTVDTAKAVAASVGRDPNSLDTMVQATLTGPTGVEAAKAAGAAEGTKVGVTQQTASDILSGGGKPGEGPNSFIIDPAKRGEMENKLRDDYLKESKSFTTARDYRSNMQSLPKDFNKWTGADDIVAVFAFMKMQDPNSAVMPGEQANAANAGGVPEAVRGMYNKLIGGGTLGVGAREQLTETSGRVFKERVQNYNDTTKQFESIAKRQGLNPKNIIIDFNSPQPQKTPSGTTFTILSP